MYLFCVGYETAERDDQEGEEKVDSSGMIVLQSCLRSSMISFSTVILKLSASSRVVCMCSSVSSIHNKIITQS